MLKKLVCALYLMSSITVASVGNGCGYPDMRLDQGPGADYFKHIPVMRQAGISYCVSAVISQQFDYFRYKNGDKDFQHQTSPLFMAMDSKNNLGDILTGWINENIMRGISQKGTTETLRGESDLCGPFKQFKRQGSCNRKFIEDDIEKKFTVFSNFKSEDRVERYLDFMDMFFEGHAPNKFMDLIGLELRTATGATSDLQCRLQEFMVPPKFIPDIVQLEYALSQITKTQYNKEILRKRCQETIPVPTNLRCRSAKTNMMKGLTQWTIHSLLNKEVPVGIGICEGVLHEGNSFNKSTMTCKPKHALLVIGRRSINGKCEYLLRNSAGKSCEGISKDWQCDESTGQIWIEQNKLLKHTDAISSLSI